MAEQAAQHVATLTAQDEIDGKVVRQAGCCDIVVVDAVPDCLSHGLVDEGLEFDPYRRHCASRTQAAERCSETVAGPSAQPYDFTALTKVSTAGEKRLPATVTRQTSRVTSGSMTGRTCRPGITA